MRVYNPLQIFFYSFVDEYPKLRKVITKNAITIINCFTSAAVHDFPIFNWN